MKNTKIVKSALIYLCMSSSNGIFLAQTANAYQKREGGSLNIRGSREDATQYIVDGIKVIGGSNIPKFAIQEITVITGGVQAQYGDATGGIVVITTKSACNQ